MGYYTDYNLEVSRVKGEDEARLIERIKDELGMETWGMSWYANAKWYDHEKDMKALSSEFPEVLFTLEGRGEEWDDAWVKYFLGGKMQVCYAEITFPPLDEAKMT